MLANVVSQIRDKASSIQNCELFEVQVGQNPQSSELQRLYICPWSTSVLKTNFAHC